MTTITQRLREIASHLDDLACGGPDEFASSLRDIAAGLESAPAVDAVPVVAWEIRDSIGFVGMEFHEVDASKAERDGWSADPLIRQRDHLATVAALQARISALEARQVPEGEVHFIQGGKLVGKIINVGSQPDTSKEQP